MAATWNLRYSCEEIYLSLYPDNERAFTLYSNLGFERNGELDTKGEQIMVLKKSTWDRNQNFKRDVDSNLL